MRNICNILLLVILLEPYGNGVSVVANAQDLPPRGRSYFDYMLASAGIAYDGKPLPAKGNPFVQLVHDMNKQTFFFAGLFPYGRSLQKMAAYPDSLRYPRVILASTADKQNTNMPFTGRLFVGYVEPAGKLEVISYNPAMGRYEFQVVTNFYPGGKAKLSYVDRKVCMRCHQGGVPIFAGGDWLEATAFNPELRAAAEKAIGAANYMGIPLARDQPSEVFDLISRPERVDDMVTFGARIIGYQKAMHSMCSQEKSKKKILACRKELVKWMIVTNLDAGLTLPANKSLIAKFNRELSKGFVSVPTDKIEDHNPMVNGSLSYHMPAKIDPSMPRDDLRLIMPTDKNHRGDSYYKFYTLLRSMGKTFLSHQDISFLRKIFRIEKNLQKPVVIDINNIKGDDYSIRKISGSNDLKELSSMKGKCSNLDGISQCIFKGNQHSLNLKYSWHKELSKSKLTETSLGRVRGYFCNPSPFSVRKYLQQSSGLSKTVRLDSLKLYCHTYSFQTISDVVDSLTLKDGPFVREDLLKEIGRVTQKKYWSQIWSLDKPLPFKAKKMDKSRFLPLSSVKHPLVKNFYEYCGECHLHQELPSNFLAGVSEQEILEKLVSKRDLIKMRLRLKQMPPKFAHQKLNEKNRAEMISALEALLE